MSNRTRCSCGYFNVAGIGDPSSPMLVLMDYPSFEDQKNGEHLTGPTADIMRREFAIAKISLNSCYVTSLYPHVYSEECAENVIDRAAGLFKGKKKVILMGTDAVEPFFGRNAIDLCGVWQKDAAFPGVKFMPCISPGTVLKNDLGEFRLALSRFGE